MASDVGSGALMANAGAIAAAYNVRINLKSITDKSFSSTTLNKLETSLKDCENTLETILKMLRNAFRILFCYLLKNKIDYTKSNYY